jgi:hypothetical protein
MAEMFNKELLFWFDIVENTMNTRTFDILVSIPGIFKFYLFEIGVVNGFEAIVILTLNKDMGFEMMSGCYTFAIFIPGPENSL